jgi:hypothetical protein
MDAKIRVYQYKTVRKIWKSNKIPNDWKKEIISNLRNKIRYCYNYRTITLLSQLQIILTSAEKL